MRLTSVGFTAPNHRSRIVLLIAALSLLRGCALVPHDPAPSLSPSQQALPWLVHCETAESHQPDEALMPGVHNERWLWAKDANGDAIVLEGHLEDGFLSVHGIRQQDSNTLRATSLGDLRQACLQTLRARDPVQPLELGKVRAARHGEEIDVTMVFPPQSPPPYPVRRVVIFGDSLSDTGRLKRRLHVFPGNPYWLGRFTNGPGWPDYLAAESGLAVQNHSYGGASATLHEAVPGDEMLARIKQAGQLMVTGSLEQQVDDYLQRNLDGRQVQHPERTVFIIWAGANDYIWKEPFTGAITTFLNTREGAAGYERVVNEVVAAISGQVLKLHAVGARRFLLINLPDLGTTPIVLQNKTYAPPFAPGSDDARKLELSHRLSKLSDYHNHQVQIAVDELTRQLPDSDILLEDSAQATRQLLQDSGAGMFGFNLDANQQTLMGEGEAKDFQQRCYAGGYLGSSDPDDVCVQQETAFFWDVIHPTTYAHCWQAWFIGERMASAQWIAPLPTPEEQRQWCALISSRQNGHRETAWRLSGL